MANIDRRSLCRIFTAISLLILFINETSLAQEKLTRHSKWKLTWQDEFDGPDGSPVDASKWTAEVGGNGWGNRELQYYTNRIENAYQDNGSLVIKAIKEKYTGADKVAREYTSARLVTKKTFTTQYGRFVARIKVPRGQGIWPAFWMLGVDIDKVGWPKSGEIDIMEHIGKEPANIYATIHGPGYSGKGGPSTVYSLPGKDKFGDDFHTFALEWEPDVLRFYCDDVLFKTATPKDLPTGTKWVYERPYFILLNLAIGGNWPGSPDATTVFPQVMLVDYVRVYQTKPIR